MGRLFLEFRSSEPLALLRNFWGICYDASTPCVDFSLSILASRVDEAQNSNPYYWMWGGVPIWELSMLVSRILMSPPVNRWLSVRFNLVSAAIVGATGLVCLVTPRITASFAGFALAFASTITGDLLFMVSNVILFEFLECKKKSGSTICWSGTINGS